MEWLTHYHYCQICQKWWVHVELGCGGARTQECYYCSMGIEEESFEYLLYG